MHVTAVTQV